MKTTPSPHRIRLPCAGGRAPHACGPVPYLVLRRHPVWMRLLGLWMLLALGFTSGPVQAVDLFWTGAVSNNTWNPLTNWSLSSGADTPNPLSLGSNDTFNFSTVNGDQIVYLDGDQSVAGLFYTNTGRTTLLGGNDLTPAVNTLTLGPAVPGDPVRIEVRSGAGAVTLGDAGAAKVHLSVSGAPVFTNDSASSFHIVNDVSVTDGLDLTLSGEGVGLGTLSGVVSSSGKVVKSGASSWALLGANLFSGSFELLEGVAFAGADTALGVGSLFLKAGTLSGGGASPRSFPNHYILGGTVTLGTANMGALTVGGTGQIISTSSFWVSPGLIAGLDSGFNGSVDFELTKAGAGTLRFNSSAPAFAGTVRVVGGMVLMGASQVMGTGKVILDGMTNPLVLASAVAGVGTLDNSKSEFKGGITLGTSSALGRIVFSNEVAVPQKTNLTVQSLSGDPSPWVDIQGRLSGNEALQKLGPGTLRLAWSGSPVFTGSVGLQAGTLRVVDDKSLGTGSLWLSGGTLRSDSGAALTISRPIFMNGSTTTLGTVGAGSLTLTHDVELKQGSTVSVPTGVFSTLSGDLSGGLYLGKTGGGTLELTNSSPSLGAGGTLFQGTLRVAAWNFGPSGVFRFAGGTLQYSAGSTTDYSGKITLVAGGTVGIDTNGEDVTYANAIGSSAAGSVWKSGLGKLTLQQRPTHTGSTSAVGGSLIVQGAGVLASNSLVTGNDGVLYLDTGVSLPATVVNGTSGTIMLQAGMLNLRGGSYGGTLRTVDGVAASDLPVTTFSDLSTRSFVTLAGPNLFSGDVMVGNAVYASTLILGTSSVAEDLPNNIKASGPAGLGKIKIFPGGTLSADSSSGARREISNIVELVDNTVFLGRSGTLVLNGFVDFAGIQSTDASASPRLAVATDNLGVGGMVVLNDLSDLPLSGVLTKVGGGSLVLGDPNGRFGMKLEISEGMAQIDSSAVWAGPLQPGNIELKGGTFQYGIGYAEDLSPYLTMFPATNGGVSVLSGGSITLASSIAGGAGATFLKMGGGTLQLSAQNYFSTVVLRAGTLIASSLGALGAAAAPLQFSGGTLGYRSTMTQDLSARFATVGAAELVSIDVDSTRITFSNPISGAGGFRKLGTGILNLPSANSHAGMNAVLAGILNIRNGNALGSGAVQVGSQTMGATLQLEGGITLSGGSLSFSRLGAAGQTGAIVNQSGNNTIARVLQAGSPSTISSDSGVLSVGTIASNGSILTLDGQGNGIVSGSVHSNTSSGALYKQGVGTWTLTGGSASSYRDTYVRGGSLLLDYTSTGSLLLESGQIFFNGGTLVLKGNASGNTTQVSGAPSILSGGSRIRLAPNGGSGTTLQMTGPPVVSSASGGDLLIESPSNTSVQFATAASGSLMFGGRAVFTDGLGGYNFATNSGASTDTTALSGYTSPLPSGGASNTGIYSHSGALNLVSTSSIRALKLASSAASQSLSIPTTGSLMLNTPAFLFTGAHDYSITNGSIGGAAASGFEMVVHHYGTGVLTISSTLRFGTVAGTTGILTKTGPGTLVLTGSNGIWFRGSTNINGGILSIRSNSNLGAGSLGSSLNLRSGSLQVTESFTLSNAGANRRPVSVGYGRAAVDVTGGNVFTIDGIVSSAAGSGSPLVKTSSGTLVLSGTNTFEAGLRMEGGTISVGADVNLGTWGSPLIFSGGTLLQTTAFNTDRTINLEGPGLMRLASGTTNLTGLIIGAGSLTLSGSGASAGSFTLSGSNRHSGGTFLDAGTLLLLSSDALGSGSITVMTGGTLVLAAELKNTLSMGIGNGSVQPANVFLPAAGTLLGGAVVLAGSASFGNPVEGGSYILNGSVVLGAASTFGAQTSGTIQGAISGAYDFVKTGPGVLTLAGTHTHSGTTRVSEGSLVLSSTIAFGSGTLWVDSGVITPATLVFSTAGAQAVVGAGTTVMGSGMLQVSSSSTVDTSLASLPGATLRPFAAAVPGSLSVGTLLLGGTLMARLDAGSLADYLNVAGSLSFGAAGSLVLTDGLGFAGSGNYTVATYTRAYEASYGTLSGVNVERIVGMRVLNVNYEPNRLTIDVERWMVEGKWLGVVADRLWSNSDNWLYGTIPGKMFNGVDVAVFGTLAAGGAVIVEEAMPPKALYSMNIQSGSTGLGYQFGAGAAGTGTIRLGTVGVGAAQIVVFDGTHRIGSDVIVELGTLSDTSSAVRMDIQRGDSELVIAGSLYGGTGGTGPMAGVGFVKVGAGTLTLTGVNALVGTLEVLGGTLAVAGTGTLTQGTVLVNGSTARMGLGNTQQTVGSLWLVDGTVESGSLEAGSFVLENGEVSGSLNGAGWVSKVSSGTVVLSGANALSGSIEVLAGTLAVGGAGLLTSGTVRVGGAAAVLSLGTSAQSVGYFLLSEGLSQGGSLWAPVFGLETGTVSSVLAGAGVVNKTTGGTVWLTGTNVLTGTMQVWDGTLAVGGYGRLSAGSLLVSGAGAWVSLGSSSQVVGSLRLVEGTVEAGTLTAGSFAVEKGVVSGVLAGGGTFTKLTGGTVWLSGANTLSGSLFVNEGTLAVSGGGSLTTGTVLLSGGTSYLTLGDTEQSVGVFWMQSGVMERGVLSAGSFVLESGLVSGVLNGPGTALKTTTGVTTLSGANTLGGSLRVQEGTLEVVSGGSLTTGTLTLESAGVKVTLGNTEQRVGRLYMVDGLLEAGTLSVGSGDGVLHAGTVSAVLGGTATVSKVSSGTVWLTGSNVLSGTMRVEEGSLMVAAPGALTLGTLWMGPTYVWNVVDLGSTEQTVGRLILDTGSLRNGTLRTAAAAGTAGFILRHGTVGAVLDGVSMAEKRYLPYFSGGTVYLNAANTLTGTVLVSGGTLVVQESGSLTGGTLLVSAGSYGGVATPAYVDLTTTHQVVNKALVMEGTLYGGTLTAGSFESDRAKISTILNGGATYRKVGSGSTYLYGVNTLSGSMYAQSGSLAVAGSGLLTSGTVAVSGSARLDLGGTQQNISLLSLQQGWVQNGSLLAGSYAVERGVISARLLGAGTLTKTLSSWVTLSGSNVLSGSMIVRTGSLLVTGAGTLTSGTVSIAGAGLNDALVLVDTNQSIGRLHLRNGLVMGTIGQSTLTAGRWDVELGTMSAVLAGSGFFSKTTGGSVTLTGTNVLTGSMQIAGGSLLAFGSGKLTAGTVLLSAGSSRLDLSTTNQSIGRLYLVDGTVSSGTLAAGTFDLEKGAVSSILAGSGVVSKTTGGTVTFSGTNTLSGTIGVYGGSLGLVGSGKLTSGTVVVNGSSALVSLGTTAQTIGRLWLVNGTVRGGTLSAGTVDLESGTVSSAIVLAGSVVKTTAGAVTLSGSSSFSTGVVMSAGTLRLGNDYGLGTGSLTFQSGRVSSDGTTARTAPNGLILTNNVTFGDSVRSGTLTFGGAVDLTADTTVNIDSAVFFAGPVSGGFGLSKYGYGELTLSGVNSFTGTLRVGEGTVALSGGSAMVNTGTVEVLVGGTLRVAGDEEIGYLAGLGRVESGTSALTVSGSGDSVFGGVLAGAGWLIKTGAGQLSLTGSNVLTGTAWVKEGTLRLGDGGTAGWLPGNGSIVSDGTFAFGRVDTVNQGTDFGLLSGGTGVVVHGAPGVVRLTGVNAFTGTFLVEQGTLLMGTGAGLAAGVMRMGAGSTLGVEASWSAGALGTQAVEFLGTASQVTQVSGTLGVVAGGTLALGKVAGSKTLTRINGGLDMAGGYIHLRLDQPLVSDFGGDGLDITGNLSFGTGQAKVLLSKMGGSVGFGRYRIMRYTGTQSGFLFIDTASEVYADDKFPIIEYDLLQKVVNVVVVDGKGYVMTWGDNTTGMLGGVVSAAVSTPTMSPTVSGVQHIAYGGGHTLLIDATGTLYSGGVNAYGQLGEGNQYVPKSATTNAVFAPVDFFAGRQVISVAAGMRHSVAVTSDGRVYAWGSTENGRLGVGALPTTPPVFSYAYPVQVFSGGTLSGRKIEVVVSGGSSGAHTLALDSGGTLYAWGANDKGQLGTGDYFERTQPAMVVKQSGALEGRRVTMAAASSKYSLAVADGIVHGWGRNSSGELGDGTQTDRTVPVAVQGGDVAGKTMIAVAAGENHSLALDSEGKVYGWGSNAHGQLGMPASDGVQAVPVRIESGSLAGRRVVGIAAGANHSIALLEDGVLVTWGNNDRGQLGDTTLVSSSVPRILPVSLSGFTGVVAGGNCSAGLGGICFRQQPTAESAAVTGLPVSVSAHARLAGDPFGVRDAEVSYFWSPGGGVLRSTTLVTPGGAFEVQVTASYLPMSLSVSSKKLTIVPVVGALPTEPPVLVSRPVSRILPVDGGEVFSLVVSGTGTAYVWEYHDGSAWVPVGGSVNSDTVSLLRIPATAAGWYRVRAYNVVGNLRDAEGAEVVPDFYVRSWGRIAGTYQALLRNTAQPTPAADSGTDLRYPGRVTVTVSATGSFSGSLEYFGQSYAFTGVFDPETVSSSLSIARGSLPSLDFELKLTEGDLESETLSVAVSELLRESGTARVAWMEQSALSPTQLRSGATLKRGIGSGSSVLGRSFSAVMKGSSAGVSTPGGYAFMSVSATGLVSMVARLGEGTDVTDTAAVSSYLVAEDTAALYRSLYGTGRLAGVVRLQEPAEAGADTSAVLQPDGEWEWKNPGVVSGISVTFRGSGYSIVPGVVITGGGGLDAAASAVMVAGQVVVVNVTNPGYGYSTEPTVSVNKNGAQASSTSFRTAIVTPKVAPAFTRKLSAFGTVYTQPSAAGEMTAENMLGTASGSTLSFRSFATAGEAFEVVLPAGTWGLNDAQIPAVPASLTGVWSISGGVQESATTAVSQLAITPVASSPLRSLSFKTTTGTTTSNYSPKGIVIQRDVYSSGALVVPKGVYGVLSVGGTQWSEWCIR